MTTPNQPEADAYKHRHPDATAASGDSAKSAAATLEHVIHDRENRSTEEISEVNKVANKFDNPRVGRRMTHAAGAQGVSRAMKFAIPARGLLPLLTMNKPGGIDCPGCAWPDPSNSNLGVVEFCENGAKAVAEETTPTRCTPEFFDQHSVTELREKTDFWLGRQGRLTTPMVYTQGTDDHYHPISWNDAIQLIADKLGSIDPNEAVFYTSGRASNEAAYMFQLLSRRLGTNNLPDCSNMCHESSGRAMIPTLGIGKGSVTMEDFYTTDLIISMGQNPGTNHPRMLSTILKAKHNGAKMVAINPLPEAGLMNFQEPQNPKGMLGFSEKLADEYLQIRLDGDLAFLQALNRELIRRDAIDHEFLDKFCSGMDEVIEHLKGLDDEDILKATGLQMSQIEKVADLVEESSTCIVSWTLGLTQHKDSVRTIREIVNFLLLTGNIGKPGAGTAPLRGHSNVQGNRTMGIWEDADPKFMDALEREFGFTAPREIGYDTVNALRAMRDGKTKFFMSLGGNFVRVTSDTTACEKGMASNDLTVSISTKLNGTHLWPGKQSLILPTLGRTDEDLQATGRQVISVEDSAGAINPSEGKRTANKDLNLRSEMDIIGEIGERTFRDDYWRPMIDNYDVIRDHIERTIPGFDDYNRRLHEEDGFMLPNGARERVFKTDDGKAHLTVNKLEPLEVPAGRLLLQTVRSHDQYNSTIYGLNDRYRGVYNGRRVIFANPQDLRELGLVDGDMVDIVSEYADGERRAPSFRVIAYSTARQCAAAYFPEANVLVPVDSVADESNTPISKSIVVRLEPLGWNAKDPK